MAAFRAIADLLIACGYGDKPGVNTNCAPVLTIVKTCTATGAQDVSLGEISGIEGKVIDCLIIARDTNAANVTIKNGSDAITDVMAKSTTTATITRATKIADTSGTIDNGDELVATFSAAASVDVVILVAPTSIPD